jgi:serine/threonine protein kinase
MAVTIQRISPAYVTRCLLPEPNGTYIVRYPTANDSVIASISFHGNYEEDSSEFSFVVISIRVDETNHYNFLEQYRLACTEENIQRDVEEILERYNDRQYETKLGKFIPLTKELIPPPEDETWTLNRAPFDGDIFVKSVKHGKNNDGVSATTWKCDQRKNVKVFIKRFTEDPLSVQHELSILKDLSYPSIVMCIGQYTAGLKNYLVFEDGGKTLESCCPMSHLEWRKMMNFIVNAGCQIANAMLYLEKKNVVHRDLTASNVLIDARGRIRVADFGHAIKKEQGTNTLTPAPPVQDKSCFQHRFLAPECFVGPKQKGNTVDAAASHAQFTSKSDVWSFGLVIIQMFLKEPDRPYPAVLTKDIPKHVKIEKNIHPQPQGCPDDLYLMLQGCWEYEAKDRLSFNDIREKLYQCEKIFR